MKLSSFGIIKVTRKISVSIFAFVSLFLFFCSQGILYSLIFTTCAILHECSHLYFLKHYGASLNSITIYPFGVDINADTSRLSYKKELVCTLSGSLANLIFALFAYVLFVLLPSPEVLFFILCNLFLGLINLIPLSFFDGGKALRLLVYDIFEIDKAFYVHKSLDIISALIFVFFCFYAIVSSDFNFSVCAVIIYAAISTLAIYGKNPCRDS